MSRYMVTALRTCTLAAGIAGGLAAPGSQAWALQIFENFDADPGWTAVDNMTSPNSYGWSNTNNAGGTAAGEIGGHIARSPATQYFTDVGSLDPSSDTLTMSGTAAFTGTDGGNSYLAWFDKDTSLDEAPDNFLGMMTDEDDVYLVYAAGGSAKTIQAMSFNRPFNTVWTFSLTYDPSGNGGLGTITASVDGAEATVRNLLAGEKDAFTNLDSFGLLNTHFPDQTFFTEVFFDDLSYTTAPTLVPGDFDSDGDVDGADFVAWQTNFPKANGATLAEGDADADGDVDGADFVVWQTNFPFTPSLSVSPVPEPHALAISAIGAMSWLIALRWRHRP